MPNNVGFTGTRQGMTPYQMNSLEACLQFAFDGPGSEFHHGLCIGADDEAAQIAYAVGYKIIAHPGIVHPSKSGSFAHNDQVLERKLPLIRNHDIVDAVNELYAAPKESREVLRSGTWATIRYARKRGIYIAVLDPACIRDYNGA